MNLFTIILISVLLLGKDVFCYRTEGKLKNYLFSQRSYDPSLRPVNTSKVVTVHKTIDIRQIIEMDERNQILFSYLWYTWNWIDSRLAWNTSEFDGMKVFRTKPETVWTPDIILYNDVREEARELSEYHAYVYSNGKVEWIFPVLMKSACKVSVRYFPFEQQVCPVKFGSSAYDIDFIDVRNMSEYGIKKSFTINGEFRLVEIYVRHRVIRYDCCPKPFAVLTYYIVLRRKPLFTLLNLVLPCVVLAAITVMGFYLPPDSGEKISVGITALVALFVFLLLVEQWMPPQSEVVPLISWFFIVTICLLTLSLGISVAIMNMFYRGQHGNTFPKCLRVFVFGCLARVLFMRDTYQNLQNEAKELDELRQARISTSLTGSVINKAGAISKLRRLAHGGKAKDYDSDSLVSDEESTTEAASSSTQSKLAAVFNFRPKRASPPPESQDNEDETKVDPDLKALRDLRKNVSQIASKIEVFERLQTKKEEYDVTDFEWKLAAAVIDRAFLVLFFCATVAVCCGLFIVNPNYKLTEKDFT